MTQGSMRTVPVSKIELRMVQALLKAAGPYWEARGLCQVGNDAIGFPIEHRNHVITVLLVAPLLGWEAEVVRHLVYKVSEVR